MTYNKQNVFRSFDVVILLCVIIIVAVGLLFLYSASRGLSANLAHTLMIRQLISISVGFIFFIIFVSFDYQRLIDFSPFLYVVNIALLIFVLYMGARKLGATRWLTFGVISFQPSEFVKISFILMLAAYLGRQRDLVQNNGVIVVSILLMLPAFFLIAAEPDLGTALVLIPIFISMIFIAGVNIKAIVGCALFGLLSSPFVWHLLKDYQKKRLMVFMNPNLDPLGAGYTIIQSKIAIGSGCIYGKGWLSGTQNQLNFLPERHTDFIFSVVGEEWGFVGGAMLLLLFLIIIIRGIKIINDTTDFYGKIIAAGIVGLFSFQVVVNIGMTMGLLPVVGLTLPFISYGGSSFISSMIAVGILLNIGMRKPLY